MLQIAQGCLGLAALVGIAWLFSEKKRDVRITGVLIGIAAQIVIALIMLKIPVFKTIFEGLNNLVLTLDKATTAGTTFLFGYLGGGTLPFKEPYPGAAWIMAFRALPLMLVISALSALLYYWRVLPLLVRGFSFLLQKTLRVGGAIGVALSANIFVGMIEAPIFIRPYLERMTRSEMFTLMTGGMATIAGTVLVIYAFILKDVIPHAMGQILAASIISAPAAIVVSRIMVPESEDITHGGMDPEQTASSSMDAVTRGTADGVQLVINVAGMLIVLVALVALVNAMLGAVSPENNPITLQGILGWIMSPIVWLIGIPWSEAQTAGSLMGTKTILNEFIAYIELSKLPAEALSERSRIIMTYAMCGFANFGSLGIMIGGLASMVPDRRSEIVGLGMRSIVSGTLSTLMTGAIVGLII